MMPLKHIAEVLWEEVVQILATQVSGFDMQDMVGACLLLSECTDLNVPEVVFAGNMTELQFRNKLNGKKEIVTNENFRLWVKYAAALKK